MQNAAAKKALASPSSKINEAAKPGDELRDKKFNKLMARQRITEWCQRRQPQPLIEPSKGTSKLRQGKILKKNSGADIDTCLVPCKVSHLPASVNTSFVDAWCKKNIQDRSWALLLNESSEIQAGSECHKWNQFLIVYQECLWNNMFTSTLSAWKSSRNWSFQVFVYVPVQLNIWTTLSQAGKCPKILKIYFHLKCFLGIMR